MLAGVGDRAASIRIGCKVVHASLHLIPTKPLKVVATEAASYVRFTGDVSRSEAMRDCGYYEASDSETRKDPFKNLNKSCFQDRRPAANMDPYLVSQLLARGLHGLTENSHFICFINPMISWLAAPPCSASRTSTDRDDMYRLRGLKQKHGACCNKKGGCSNSTLTRNEHLHTFSLRVRKNQ